MKCLTRISIRLLAATLVTATVAVAGAPSLVSYQGVLTDPTGQPVNGMYAMKFIIYDGPTTESNSLWGEMQTVEVTDGMFSVLLGAVNPLTDAVFSDTGRYLGITVGTGEPEISPRTPLVSVPYALRVQTIDGATGGDIYGNLQLHSTFKIGNTAGSAGRVEITDGSSVTIVADGATGNVGIGSAAPSEKLEVDGTAQVLGFIMPTDASAGYVLTSDAAGIGTWQPATGESAWNWSDSSSHGPDSVLYADTSSYASHVQTVDEATAGDIYGNLTLHSNLTIGDGSGEPGYINMSNGSGYTIHIGGKDASDNGAIMRLENSSGDRTIILDADDYQAADEGGTLKLTDGVFPDTTIALDSWDVGGGAVMKMGNSEGDATIILDARDAQEADIGARMTLLDGSYEAIILNAIDPSTSFGAQLIMRVGNDTTVSIYANGDYGDGGGIIRLYDDDSTKTVHIDANGATYGGAQLSLSDNDGTTTISLDAESGSGGGAFVSMHDSVGTKTIHMDANGSSGGAQVSLMDHDSTTTISLDAESGVNGGANVKLLTGAGVETIRLDANYAGTGEGRVITSVLEITGGSDLSEQFKIRADDARLTASPGMVVCIDPDHPGELVISSRAYDPTVAGIISGAGGIKPGMLMGQAGSVSDGQYAVALTGRVYCRADASYGSIRPGDLITTSDTPGHAMRVSDPARAYGATIGKAMSSLAEGRGLVLVLVGLQ